MSPDEFLPRVLSFKVLPVNGLLLYMFSLGWSLFQEGGNNSTKNSLFQVFAFTLNMSSIRQQFN